MLRKLSLGILLPVFLLTGVQKTHAQAFEKGGTYLNVNIGGGHLFLVNKNGWSGSVNGGAQVQMEWGIHKYVGLGFAAGIMGGRYGWGYGYGYYGYGYGGGYGGYGVLSVPVGIIANFHFYQLIEDKTTKDIHGDKLDIYAGVNAGSGIGYVPTPRVLSALFFAGPQVGVRYYFKPNIAVGGEVGYGKTFVNGGVTFKL